MVRGGDDISSSAWSDRIRRNGLCALAATAVGVSLVLAGLLSGGPRNLTAAGFPTSSLDRSRDAAFSLTHLGGLLGDSASSSSRASSSPKNANDAGESKAGPFVAVRGMFEYEHWKKELFDYAMTGGSLPLHQSLPNYGASLPWESIRRAISTGAGAKGRRKLFFLARHAQAVHNQWGMAQKSVRRVDQIPCTYKTRADMVDPALTAKGRRDSHEHMHTVFLTGLAEEVGRRVRVFSSPLSRCMQTSQIGLQNGSGLDVVGAGGRVTVSELLRERIDARVPFETRRPVSFVPVGRPIGDEEAAASQTEGGEGEKGDAGAASGNSTTSDGSCFVPSKGLAGHPGDCCLHSGLKQDFDDFFDFNVMGSGGGGGEGGGGGGCGLEELKELGWKRCAGPEMLGLLAKDDTGLEPGGEEPDAAVMERVRAWLAAVFDEVDEHVVIAVTHSDWIKHAMLEVGLGTFNWFEPRNNELIPIIIEDVRV